MPNENTIQITISADGSVAVNGVKQVTGSMKEMETETKSIAARFKEHWIGISAAVTGALYTIKKAWDLAEEAAKYQEQISALNALASQYNMSAKQVVSAVKEASNGLISMADAAAVSARALMMGLNPDQLVGFMHIVEATTNATGDSVANAFEKIAQAAATGSERILTQQLGIVIDLQGAYRKYAASIDTTAENLNDLIRQQVGINAILEQGNTIVQRLGDQTDSLADKMDRLKITIEDMKLSMGMFFTHVFATLMGMLNQIGYGFVRLAEVLVTPFALIEKLMNKVGIKDTLWQDALNNLNDTMEKLKTNTLNYFELATASGEEIARAMQKIIEQPERTHVIDPLVEKKRIEDVMKMLQELHDREALLGKSADQRDLIALAQKQRNEMKILADAHASFAQMDDASRIHALENDALIAEQKKKHIEEEMRLKETLYRREKELQQEQIRMQQDASDSYWQNQMGMVNQLGGELGKGMGMIGAGLKGMGDIKGGTDEYSQKLDAYYNYTNDRLALSAAMFEQELVMAQEQGASEMQIRQMTSDYIQQMNDAANNYQVQQEQATFYQKLTIAQNYMGAMAGLMYSLYILTGKHHKAMFIMYKAFAVVEAMIAGIKATMDGFAWGMAHGGPYVAIAVAAFSAAFAAARVAAILAQNPGNPVADTGVTLGGGYSFQNPVQSRFDNQEKTKSQIINIYVQGNIVDHDAFARELIPSIQKATADNMH